MKNLIVSCLLLFACSAHSAIVTAPLGTLVDGTVFFGTIPDEDDSLEASLGDYWLFSGEAGDAIDIDINRTEAAPDLIAVLFSGSVIGLDMNALSPGGLVDGLLRTSGTYGPLSIISYQDDTENDTFGGPFGDPRFTLTLNSTGIFTLLVASLNVGGSYEIITTGISAANTADEVPAPSALGLMLLALCVFARTVVKARR